MKGVLYCGAELFQLALMCEEVAQREEWVRNSAQGFLSDAVNQEVHVAVFELTCLAFPPNEERDGHG